jgi:Ni/Co efflux regulator RcnB
VNYRNYGRLYAPPRGYHWVQSGNDAVLVAITSGLVGAVIGGALN